MFFMCVVFFFHFDDVYVLFFYRKIFSGKFRNISSNYSDVERKARFVTRNCASFSKNYYAILSPPFLNKYILKIRKPYAHVMKTTNRICLNRCLFEKS